MPVKPLRADLLNYAKKHRLERKLERQIAFFTVNPKHPSLHTEILEPKELKIYSFRIDRKYRAIFILTDDGEAEIVDINNHYAK